MLKKPEKGRAGSYYESYFSDSTELGVFGRVDNFERFPAKEHVFGLRLANMNVAISKEYLATKSFVFVQNSPTGVLVVFDKHSNTVSAFDVPGEFKDAVVAEGEIRLDSTVWNASKGVLISTGGSIEGSGENLDQVPVITAFWFAWASFFPETELIKWDQTLTEALTPNQRPQP